MVRYRGVITTGTPYEGLNTSSAAASGTATQPSITTSGYNRTVLLLCSAADDNTWTNFSGGTGPTPGAFAEVGYFSTTAGSDGSLEHQDGDQAAPGTVSGNTSTVTGGGGGNDDLVVTGLALKPTGG